jgi:hypothetical protein
MNCAEVESLLDRLAHPDHGDDDLEQGELQAHLAVCAACRQSLELIERWDSRIRPVLNEVTVPQGLTQRLTDALRDQMPEPTVTQVPVRTSNPWQHRLRVLSIVGMVCLFGASLWWSRQFLRQPQLTPAHVSALWEQLGDQGPLPTSTQPRLPRGWSSLNQVRAGDWQQLTLASHRLEIPVKQFELRSKRGPSETGWLLVIPKSRWGVAPLTPISVARVQYSPPRVWIAWNEGDNVYILAVVGSPQSLEQIQRQLELNNSVL